MKAIVSSVILLAIVAGIAECSMAQVTPDSTLGTQVTQAGSAFGINQGTRSGNNLFHSFSQFSVPTGSSAVFNNALDVQNIFSRVTGSQLSNIDGILKTQGTANLFFMNPNGIIFGPNAQLQLGGSFLGTTANSIQFADGIALNTLNTTPALLSVNVPIGLQFGQQPAPIQVKGMGHRLEGVQGLAPYQPYEPYSGLQVQPSQTLALIGGDLTLTGAVLQAPEARIDLGSIAQPAIVSLQPDSQGFKTTYAGISKFGTVNLTQQSILESIGNRPGNLNIQGGQVNIQEGSLISNGNFGSENGGTIAIHATQGITLTGATPIGNVLTGIRQDNFGTGAGGNILIETPNLLIQSGASIFGMNFGSGSSGQIKLQAHNLTLVGNAPNAPEVVSQAGSITFSTGIGDNVFVSTQNLSVLAGAFIGASTFGAGENGGDVVVNSDRIMVDGRSPIGVSSAIGDYSLGFSGQSGNLTVNTRTLEITNGGLVETSTISNGNAGNLLINARESIVVKGYGSSEVYESTISSSVSRPTAIYQQLFGLAPIPTANGGSVEINTPSLTVREGGNVNVSNYGIGNAGILTIRAGKIQLGDDAIIGALTSEGAGGDINIYANSIVLRNRSVIIAAASGNQNLGSGGNILINSATIVGLENSDIRADATQGNGGNILITTQGLLGLKFRIEQTPENDINASSQFGINGNVQVSKFGINPTNTLNALPIDIVDSSRQIANRCRAAKNSSFILTGRGGMPKNPIHKSQTDRAWHDIRSTSSNHLSSIQPSIIQKSIGPIIEASSFQRDESGAIFLGTGSSKALVAGGPIEPQTAITCAISDSH